MSRGELADAVNRALDRLYAERDLTSQYVDFRWVGKLERVESRWPSAERCAALRMVVGVASDQDLDLYSPRRNPVVAAAAPVTFAPLAVDDWSRPSTSCASSGAFIEAALPTIPRIHRQDYASALLYKATAHAAAQQPEAAAATAHTALPIVRYAGSRRLLQGLKELGSRLDSHRNLAEVSAYLDDLAKTG